MTKKSMINLQGRWTLVMELDAKESNAFQTESTFSEQAKQKFFQRFKGKHLFSPILNRRWSQQKFFFIDGRREKFKRINIDNCSNKFFFNNNYLTRSWLMRKKTSRHFENLFDVLVWRHFVANTWSEDISLTFEWKASMFLACGEHALRFKKHSKTSWRNKCQQWRMLKRAKKLWRRKKFFFFTTLLRT